MDGDKQKVDDCGNVSTGSGNAVCVASPQPVSSISTTISQSGSGSQAAVVSSTTDVRPASAPGQIQKASSNSATTVRSAKWKQKKADWKRNGYSKGGRGGVKSKLIGNSVKSMESSTQGWLDAKVSKDLDYLQRRVDGLKSILSSRTGSPCQAEAQETSKGSQSQGSDGSVGAGVGEFEERGEVRQEEEGEKDEVVSMDALDLADFSDWSCSYRTATYYVPNPFYLLLLLSLLLVASSVYQMTYHFERNFSEIDLPPFEYELRQLRPFNDLLHSAADVLGQIPIHGFIEATALANSLLESWLGKFSILDVQHVKFNQFTKVNVSSCIPRLGEVEGWRHALMVMDCDTAIYLYNWLPYYLLEIVLVLMYVKVMSYTRIVSHWRLHDLVVWRAVRPVLMKEGTRRTDFRPDAHRAVKMKYKDPHLWEVQRSDDNVTSRVVACVLNWIIARANPVFGRMVDSFRCTRRLRFSTSRSRVRVVSMELVSHWMTLKIMDPWQDLSTMRERLSAAAKTTFTVNEDRYMSLYPGLHVMPNSVEVAAAIFYAEQQKKHSGFRGPQ